MLSQRNAEKIIREADLPEGQIGKVLKYASAPKSLRRELMRLDPEGEDARICAAIEIQRVARSYNTRCRLLSTVLPQLSQTAIYGNQDSERLDDVSTPTPMSPSKSLGRQRLEQHYNEYSSQMALQGDTPQSFQDFIASYIKDWWKKKYMTREDSKPTEVAKPQPKPRKRLDLPLTEKQAASMIQKAWRRHIDIQVYRYYRDLINFRSRGDPTLMLRCINPNEAKMLDAASGIHIKFRLAGERFPPNIYYKIYTHRPVQDLCANSPKDYTKADSKRLMAIDVHNKGNRVPKKDCSGWYERTENNGWRLVSDRLIQHMMSDPVTWDSSKKKVDFHHNTYQRKTEREKKKKRKKIDWMKKMYHEGMLKAKVEDEDTVRLIEGAAAGMVATIERHGNEAVHDWEVDELLEWTTSLNFDDYLTGWKEIATSANSEKPLQDRLNLLASDDDPFEMKLPVNLRREGSTQLSHNTPASSQSAISIR